MSARYETVVLTGIQEHRGTKFGLHNGEVKLEVSEGQILVETDQLNQRPEAHIFISSCNTARTQVAVSEPH